MKLWGGRFKKATNQLVEEYTASISFDQLLAVEDILGSLAHVKMLQQQNVLEQSEAETIKAGLLNVFNKLQKGELEFSVQDEDIHMNIERLLTQEIGEVAGKLHTGRSRNDQVALDMHLFLRQRVLELSERILNLVKVLHTQANKNLNVILPGYTHLQRAQPVLFSHHMLAYAHKFMRDFERLKDSFKRINISPLGAGALAGTSFPLDRELVAELLCFDGVYQNSMDAVSDRDFIVEFLSNSALIATHLSRLSEELILWSSKEFDFIEIDDAFCTGSSIMPQKKNPDVAELVRAKTGRIFGNLLGLLTVLKALPLTYNKDLQEDKEGMFDTVKTLEGALDLYIPMLQSLTVKPDNMRKAVDADFSNATDLADYLAKKGLAFRQAHEIIGQLVAYCLDNQKLLKDLDLSELKQFSKDFDQSALEVIKPETVVATRTTLGGTAPEQVKLQAQELEEQITEASIWVTSTEQRMSKVELLLESQ